MSVMVEASLYMAVPVLFRTLQLVNTGEPFELEMQPAKPAVLLRNIQSEIVGDELLLEMAAPDGLARSPSKMQFRITGDELPR